MKAIIILPVLLSLGCVQQPTRQEISLWSYFLTQCENEGIPRTNINALHGCITLKLQANIGSPTGNTLEAMGYTITEGSKAQQPHSVDCHTTPLVGGYRIVCY